MLPHKGEPRFSSQYYKPTRERKVPSHLLFYEGCLMKEGGLNLKGSAGLSAGAELPLGGWPAGGFPGTSLPSASCFYFPIAGGCRLNPTTHNNTQRFACQGGAAVLACLPYSHAPMDLHCRRRPSRGSRRADVAPVRAAPAGGPGAAATRPTGLAHGGERGDSRIAPPISSRRRRRLSPGAKSCMAEFCRIAKDSRRWKSGWSESGRHRVDSNPRDPTKDDWS